MLKMIVDIIAGGCQIEPIDKLDSIEIFFKVVSRNDGVMVPNSVDARFFIVGKKRIINACIFKAKITIKTMPPMIANRHAV